VVSERRVCGLLSVAVSSYRYQAEDSNAALRGRMVELAREKPRYGYRRLHVLLRRTGEQVNHKRVYRVYREAGLCLRRKKRKHCVRTRTQTAPTLQCRQHSGSSRKQAFVRLFHDGNCSSTPRLRALSTLLPSYSNSTMTGV
jgi:putative transposase